MNGVTDLAVCNTSTNTVSVLLGNGTPGAPDGTFAAAINAASNSGPNAVAVADFDHDGRPDLVVATNTGAPGTSVMLGRGNGTFEVAQLFTTGGNGTSSIAVNDFNEDGTPDVLACNRTSLNVTRQLAGCAATLSSAITVTAPNGGESWIGATEHTLTWTKGPGVMKVNVQLSTDGGSNWRTVASGLTGTSFAWTATGPYSTHARIRVVDSHAAQFADASDADFELVDESTLAVGDDVPWLALLGAWPNPARQDLTVSFALPTGASGGTIELIDLAGRRVASRDLAEFSAGRHQVTLLERRAVTPGVYLLRLTRGQDVRSMKVAVVR
jgi:5-hydroxyisourate hydrolase-like protein (transthyretin family)